MEVVRNRVVLVDDDPYALLSLRELIQQEPGMEIAGEFNDAHAALTFLSGFTPDLLFLDIQMPGLSGFDLLDRLGSQTPEVIFVTSFNQYAIKAIKYSALDYLLKPVSATDLRDALGRFRKRAEKLNTQTRLANLRHNLDSGDEAEFNLVFLTKQGDRHFRASEIIRCEADSNYTRIHLDGGKKFLASKTLSDVEHMLEADHFLRVHKSHIINTSHVRHLTSGDEVVMSDESTVQISRRRLQEVKSLLRKLG